MAQKTPPSRPISLLSKNHIEDKGAETSPHSLPHTPLVYPGSLSASPSSNSFKHANAKQLVTPVKSTIAPETPSTWESSDSSQLRTPLGNFAPWSVESPGILSTPTPIRVFSTSKFGPISGASHHSPPRYGLSQGMLEADKQLSEKQLQYSQIAKTKTPQPPSKETRDVVREALVKSRDPSETTPLDKEVHEQVDNKEPPVLDELKQETGHAGSQNQPLTKPSIPDSILQWLDAERPHRIVVQRQSMHVAAREELLKKRLAMFTQHDQFVYKQLYPVDHQLGRVVRPRDKEEYEDDVYLIDGWTDDTYPWSQPPVVQESDIRRRQEELRLIERYLDSSSDSEEDAIETLHENDPANAKVALKAKKSTRKWLAYRAKLADSPAPPQKRTTITRSSRRIVTPIIEPEPPVEMDIDNVDGEDSDEIACICKGVDDGRPMVQCDNCQTWHHVDCVGKTEEELPDKWFCWKCPMETAPERATNIIAKEPTLVQSASDYSPNPQYRSSANIPIYQGTTSETSPSLPSPSKAQRLSTLLEEGTNYSQRTPPSANSIRYSYGPWTEEMSRHDDDPMTAIASTAFGTSNFSPSPFPPFDELAFGASPTRMIISKFNQVSASGTPRKERPWTNYVGTFSTPGGSIATSTYNPFVQQSSIQADPLFIHYEHDAPKQTAHHGSKGKRRGKGKEKEVSKGNAESKEDDSSIPTSAQSDESPSKEDMLTHQSESETGGNEVGDVAVESANKESNTAVP